jgi:glycosyltransferase involved in cell wall biosynthesis
MTAISVLMTAFNAGPFLAEAVHSLISQDVPDWELILVDNGSTDESVGAVFDLDPRIKVTRFEANIGRTPALQTALNLSVHPYIAILDADDVAVPSRFALQANFLDHHPSTVLVGSCADLINDESQKIGCLCIHSGTVSHDILGERNVFVHSSVMFRREAARSVGGYDSAFEFAQDYHLFLKLAQVGNCHVLPEPLVHLRISESSYTNRPSTQLVRAKDEAALFAFAGRELTFSREGSRLNTRRQALSVMYLGYVRLRRHDVRGGIRDLARGLFLDRRLSWVPYLLMGRRSPGRYQRDQ